MLANRVRYSQIIEEAAVDVIDMGDTFFFISGTDPRLGILTNQTLVTNENFPGGRIYIELINRGPVLPEYLFINIGSNPVRLGWQDPDLPYGGVENPVTLYNQTGNIELNLNAQRANSYDFTVNLRDGWNINAPLIAQWNVLTDGSEYAL